MTRKAWMPDPKLTAWVSFLGKLVVLLVMVGSGVFYLGTAALGLRGLRPEVDAQGVTLQRLVVSDSTGNEDFRTFRDEEFPAFVREMRCLFQMVGEGEVPGYNACGASDNSENGDES